MKNSLTSLMSAVASDIITTMTLPMASVSNQREETTDFILTGALNKTKQFNCNNYFVQLMEFRCKEELKIKVFQ